MSYDPGSYQTFQAGLGSGDVGQRVDGHSKEETGVAAAYKECA